MEKESLKPKISFISLDRSDHCERCGKTEVVQKLTCKVLHPFPTVYISARCEKHALTTEQLTEKSCIYKLYWK